MLVLVLVRVLAFLLLRVRFSQGMSKQNRNRKSNNEKKKQGADGFLVQTCSPSFFRFRKNTPSTTDCENQNVER